MATIKITNPDILLERIEDLSNLAISSAKTKGNTARDYIDRLLDALEELIGLSAHLFMSFGDIDHDEIEEEEYKQYIVHPNDIKTARKYSNFILVKLISSEMLFEDGKDDERINKAGRLIAHMSGRQAAGAITRTWHIPYLNSDGVRQELLVPLHEPGYIGNGLGAKTWGAAPMMAKKLLQQNIIPDISDCRVLELGTGTGMVGLICDHLGASEVHVTDYHPRVLENVAYNVELNQSRAKVSKLDFIKVAKGECDEWHNQKFDVVIASDLLYEMEHAEHLPMAVEKLLKKDFYFMIPLRETHWQEVNHFEAKMRSLGFFIRKTQDSDREEEEGIVRFRYYEFSREPTSNVSQ
ncbi:putative methyltransferase-domain-containing protein [Parasitella parasitica]|nr:putative methyltransferase-domain-containing protein [Parasitella parasitica]